MTAPQATLSARERFAAVFRGEIPDRVAVTLFIQDQGHLINQLYPDIDPWDHLALQLATIEVQRQMGADVMVRLLFGTLELPRLVAQRVAPIREAVGDDGWVGIWAPHGPFNMASLLTEEQELYALFHEDPDYYARLMEVSLARVRDHTRAIDASGVDILFMGGDVSLFMGGDVPGGFMGRDDYGRHILSWEARQVAWAQANGTPAAYHDCGRIQALVESCKDHGAAAVEPFSPPRS